MVTVKQTAKKVPAKKAPAKAAKATKARVRKKLPNKAVKATGLDLRREQLRQSVMGNRLRFVLEQGPTLLSELFTFIPTSCFSCKEERSPDQLILGRDYSFYCKDRDECLDRAVQLMKGTSND